MDRRAGSLVETGEAHRRRYFRSRSNKSFSVSYFTDASALSAAIGDPPVIVLGPGEASMAHRTDEYCEMTRIAEATKLFASSWLLPYDAHPNSSRNQPQWRPRLQNDQVHGD